MVEVYAVVIEDDECISVEALFSTREKRAAWLAMMEKEVEPGFYELMDYELDPELDTGGEKMEDDKTEKIKALEAEIAALKGPPAPAPDIVEEVLAKAEDGEAFRAEGLVKGHKIRLRLSPNEIQVTVWVRGGEWNHTYPYADFKTASDYYHSLIEKYGLEELK